MNYDSGIPSFDKYLDGKTLKQINAVIHLSKFPKGLVIKIAKHFSSFPFGLPYSEITRTLLSEKSTTSHLIFETTDNSKIIFSLKTADIFEVRQFLNDIHLKYDTETTVANSNLATETKANYNSKQRKK
ncbi:MAG: hypothetical protein IPP38_11580 [Bacteroidetes bacterium]|nr:hypothetical protein [Bacteroidota bacterium]